MLSTLHDEIIKTVTKAKELLDKAVTIKQAIENQAERDQIDAELHNWLLGVIGYLGGLLDDYPPGVYDGCYTLAMSQIVRLYFEIKSPLRAWNHFNKLDQVWRILHQDTIPDELLLREVMQYGDLLLQLLDVGGCWDKDNISIAIDRWIKPMRERVLRLNVVGTNESIKGVLDEIQKHIDLVYIKAPTDVQEGPGYTFRPISIGPLPDLPEDRSSTRSTPSPINFFFSAPTSPCAEQVDSMSRDCNSAPASIC